MELMGTTFVKGSMRIKMTTIYGHDPEPFVEAWVLKYWREDDDEFILVSIDDEEFDPETEWTYSRVAGNEHDEKGWVEVGNSDEDPGGRSFMGSAEMPRMMIEEIRSE